MAHVEPRGRGRWVAIWKGPDNRRRARSFTRKLDADRFLATVTVDVLAGRYVDPDAGHVTFGAYAAEWVEHRPIRASTRERYRGYLDHCHELTDVPLGRLEPSMMRAWQAALTRRMAKSTAHTIRGVVASILKSAVIDRKIPASPLEGVARPPRPDKVLVRPLPLDTVAAIRDSIYPGYRAAIVLGYGAGLRRGEAFGLTADRIDFLRRTITVDRQLVRIEAGRPVFGPPKTAASVATVPAAQSVLDALAAHIARFVPSRDTDCALLFTAPRGGPADRAKVGDAWRRVAPPGTRFHDLRHVFASTLIASGQSVKVVQARMRHATAAETLDTYSHLWPDDDDRSRAAIDAMFPPTVTVERSKP